MKRLLFFILICISYTANADYLIVQRNGNLMECSSTASEILEKIRKGDTLLLVETNQLNGYYHVISLAGQQEGWVYHKLVSRVTEELALFLPIQRRTHANSRPLMNTCYTRLNYKWSCF